MTNTDKIDQLHEWAIKLVGLDDFGGNSDGYREGMDALISAVSKDANLTELGEQALDQMMIGALTGRLLAAKGFAQNPECLQAPIRKPLIVTGFTRSGTTALHKLLASAPDTQALEHWLSVFPMPRPPRESWKERSDYQEVVAALEQQYDLVPEMRKMHLMRPDEPDECWRIMSHSFMTWALLGFFWAPSYGDWVLSTDRSGAYRRYKEVLQLIGYRNPSTWVLKDPMHLPSTDLLLEQFPDACIVHTCREPSEVIGSVCSLMYTSGSPFNKEIDKKQFGQRVFESVASQMDRFMELRERLDRTRFLDVHYESIVSKPVTLARDIYKYFDIEIGNDGEKALMQWERENKQHRYGKHEYRLEDYGINADMVNERLADYRKAYL